MKDQLIRAILFCACGIVFAAFASGQSGPQAGEKVGGKEKVTGSAVSNGGNPAMNIAGKVTVVIIKSAAKTAWATTKFAAKDVAKPILVGVAKPLLLKVTPQITMFALKLTGNSLKKGIPIATKLGMTYLRAKLPI
ncbi:MAG: hypothetical protein JNL64_13455 [Blastocatellia bacterium]|nr:hypothetical protein [Blastocatellia bacterium]